jgi:recombination protein RecA
MRDELRRLVFTARIAHEQHRREAAWCLEELAGRLVELSGHGASAVLTLAMRLVVDAQRRGEPAAWITAAGSSFYPPDAAEAGVDLDALLVVRVPEAAAVGRAADPLLRSGGFGLAVLDLGVAPLLDALQSRLLGLAQTHQAAVLCLTARKRDAGSLGSLVSLRAEAVRVRVAEGRFRVELQVLKDKRRGPGWKQAEEHRGAAGLR